ncbi:ABC transporter permease [Candidatus Xianfuyuplasma coldseepsis]|uniref:ABC transporter permease n=1 Tax=Candidatus Xianfuyuplasma coldseepsis TaxID=2782163 RepID=A0A7L7KTR0_9MOLU|nr:ABC transporter permease [Xianfuyuplasma coldseepsis]QMS85809.1 ABC transporter permease [Xianfuyuplasma coldseepsis]
MDTLYSMLALALVYSTPIIIAGLGGLFSERSGVVNIALEGLMMFGGFAGATVTVLLEPTFEGGAHLGPWIGVVVGMAVGALISLIHAFLSVNLNADQVISGTGINLFAVGATVYLAQIIFNQQRTDAFKQGFSKLNVPVLSEIPFIGDVFFSRIYPTVYIAFILVIVTWFVVYKTPFGLRLRSAGENPHASDSMGINVYRIRYVGVILSGALAGLAGAIMILTQDIQYTVFGIHGTGFIALAALIFGKWKPFGVLYAGLFFGFSQIIGIYSTSIPLISGLPGEFFKIFPYAITIIALIIFSSRTVGPKAAGEPYDKGKR